MESSDLRIIHPRPVVEPIQTKLRLLLLAIELELEIRCTDSLNRFHFNRFFLPPLIILKPHKAVIQTKRSKELFHWLVLPLLLTITSSHPVIAQGLTAEVFAGTAWSLPLPLRIQQPGEAPIRFKARYSTRPWRGAPYYAYRLGYQHWSAELVHHKLYLQNPPSEIDHFEVSHGYNLAIVSRTIPFGNSPTLFRVGLGLVIGHPEGRIRGKAIHPVPSLLGGGYQISGLCLQAAVGPQLGIADHWFFRPEAKLTAAWARMSLAGGGVATVPNIALHTLFGFGYRSLR